MADRFRVFYESVGEKYPEDQLVYQTLSGRIRKKWILQKLQTLPPGNLLDCGCNTGLLSKDWHSGDVFGVDLSYAVLHRGKANVPRTAFIQADLRDLCMFKQGSFDNAMACEVVEHLDRPAVFFKHLYRVMRKSGHVLVTTPNYSHKRPETMELGILRSFGITTGTSGNTYLHTAYRPDELAGMARTAGFAIVEQGSFEHELRGWLKPLKLFEMIFNAISRRFFPTSNLIQLFERFMNAVEVDAFLVLDTLLIARMMKHIFKQGRRSYIVAKK